MVGMREEGVEIRGEKLVKGEKRRREIERDGKGLERRSIIGEGLV